MMVEASKKLLSCCLGLALFLFCGIILCGCSNKQNLINTHNMPGHKVSELIKMVPATKQTSNDGPLTKTKSGLYIYKDNSTINTSGYRFNFKEKTDIGPTDVRFDAEHFRTRY